MKPISCRSAGPRLSGTEMLDTRFAGKALKVTVSKKPEVLADGKAIPQGDEVLVTTLENPFQVIGHLTNLLGRAGDGASLVVLCSSEKIYQAALRFLGLTAAAAGSLSP